MIEEGGEKMNRLNEELRKAKSNLAKKESEKQNVDQVLEEKRLAVERLQERLKDVQEKLKGTRNEEPRAKRRKTD